MLYWQNGLRADVAKNNTKLECIINLKMIRSICDLHNIMGRYSFRIISGTLNDVQPGLKDKK